MAEQSKESKKIKVKGTQLLKLTRYLCLPEDLKLSRKDRDVLKAGGTLEISSDKVKKFPQYFEEVKDGNR